MIFKRDESVKVEYLPGVSSYPQKETLLTEGNYMRARE